MTGMKERGKGTKGNLRRRGKGGVAEGKGKGEPRLPPRALTRRSPGGLMVFR